MTLPRLPARAAATLAVVLLLPALSIRTAGQGFDHDYRAYAGVLESHVRNGRVDYAALLAARLRLDEFVAALAAVGEGEERSWPRAQRLAFWINAYNALTLRTIIDHYPIKGSRWSLGPRNSIRQIDGAWDGIRWKAAGRQVTLDDIEHGLLRRELGEPRIHFALNCASVSCPPLRPEPYRAATLDAQLDDSARGYLASPQGLRVEGTTLRVTSILKWYGEDFVPGYASRGPAAGAATTRAVLGVLATYGPGSARAVAESGRARVDFLPYDWSLNDTATAGR